MRPPRYPRIAFVVFLMLFLISAQLPAAAGNETTPPVASPDASPVAAAFVEPANAASAPTPGPSLGQMLQTTSHRAASFETRPAPDTKSSVGAPVTLAPAMSSKAKKTWIIVGSIVGAAAIAAAVSGGGGGSGSGGGIY
jgi:hypothetical protein